jgi:putative membrane protein
MLLILCVDLDDDLGRKTGIKTPVIGRQAVEGAALALAIEDPTDSDGNVMFQGLQLYEKTLPDSVEIAVVTGSARGDMAAGRKIGEEIEEVLNRMFSGEKVRTVVVTDGAQDESIMPIIRSRVEISGVYRVVIRQSEGLESAYYTAKQFISDPETRGTLLLPLGILLLIYPMSIIFENVAGSSSILGMGATIMGVYVLYKGLGLRDSIRKTVENAKRDLYAGRVVLVAYVVSAIIIVIGSLEGFYLMEEMRNGSGININVMNTIGAFIFGGVQWFGFAGIIWSLGHITDEYLSGRMKLRYLNAPIYVVSIVGVLYAASGYVIGAVTLEFLAMVLVAGTILGFSSTLIFSIIETRREKLIRTSDGEIN